MAAAPTSAAHEKILLLYAPGRAAGKVVQPLRARHLAVITLPFSPEATWPPGDCSAAVLWTDALSPEVRLLVRRMRRQRPHAPLVLWSGGGAETLGEALEAGFDLWLAADTPVSAVAAQLRALARLTSSNGAPPEAEPVTVGSLNIDVRRAEVTAAGRTVPLTPAESRIVVRLARRPGRVVRYRELFREAHGHDAGEREARDILKATIWRIRSKLTAAGASGDCIVSLRGVGYMLERREAPAASSLLLDGSHSA